MPHHVEVTVQGIQHGKKQDLVHDIDLLTWVLGEYPGKVATKENRTDLVYPSGITATIARPDSEKNAAFEHRMLVQGKDSSCLSISNVDKDVTVTSGTGSAEAPKKRQKKEPVVLDASYQNCVMELSAFEDAATTFSPHNTVSVEDLLASNVVAEAAGTTAAHRDGGMSISYSQLDEFDAFRDYSEAPETVRECYRLQRIYQTENYVDDVLARYCKFERKGSFWELFDMLSTFVDLSDPDINLSNHQHLFQTAEGMRKDGLPEWMQVTGLIHDLGKIIYKVGRMEDGTTMESQWGIVGMRASQYCVCVSGWLRLVGQ
jgi:hypothetical protein